MPCGYENQRAGGHLAAGPPRNAAALYRTKVLAIIKQTYIRINIESAIFLLTYPEGEMVQRTEGTERKVRRYGTKT